MEGIEYNSAKENLIIPEYGRHVQEMINYARKVEDQTERQAIVERIIDLMIQMNPQNTNSPDIRTKLWKHLYRIANYDLEGVSPPDGKIPKPEDARLRPDKLEYKENKARFRHYGQYVQELVDSAVAMEDEEQQMEYLRVIGSYMKLAYRNWNREHFVSDEIVLNDLAALLRGRIELPEDMVLDHLKHHPTPNRKPQRKSNNRGGGRGRKNRGRHKK